MRKNLYLVLAALLFMTLQASAQIGGTGVYKAHSAGVDVKVVKKPRNAPFIGFTAGIGGTFGTITSLDGAVGADFAFAPSKKFAMGFFTGYETFTKINIGLLFVHGDYSTKGAFIWGLGYSRVLPYSKKMTFANTNYIRHYYDGDRFLMRLGYLPKSPWYFNVTLSYGALRSYDDYTNYDGYYGDSYYFGRRTTVGVIASVGYKLNIKSKKTNE